MSDKGKLRQAVDDFLKKIQANLPARKADKLFVLGFVGLIASGKSAAAKMLAEKIPGAVLVKSNSARWLLKEAGLKWGDNVREMTFRTASWLLENGYAVIFDGDHAEEQKRIATQKLADEADVPFYLVRIKPDAELSRRRLRQKQETLERGEFLQDFENFLVVTRGKEENLERRIPLHEALESEKLSQLIGELDNSGTMEELKNQLEGIAERIK